MAVIYNKSLDNFSFKRRYGYCVCYSHWKSPREEHMQEKRVLDNLLVLMSFCGTRMVPDTLIYNIQDLRIFWRKNRQGIPLKMCLCCCHQSLGLAHTLHHVSFAHFNNHINLI